MTWSTAVILSVFMLSTLARLDRLEHAANLTPGKENFC